MPSILNSDDGVVSGTSGLKSTGGNDGITTFQQNGTERMRIDSSGNVGIGTNSPSYKLHVSGAGNQTAAVASSSSNAVLRLTSSNGFDQIIEYTTVSTAGLAIKDATAGLNRAYIDNNGNITFRNNISVGNATPTTSGTGITFPATQSASTNANTLDDYEEGTWTPVLTDGTNNATSNAETAGIYVKIGRTVYITATMYTTSLGSVSGDIYISGLPFTSPNQNPKVSLAIGSAELLNISANQVMGAYIDSNESRIRLRLWDSTGGTTALQASEWSADGLAFITGTYYV